MRQTGLVALMTRFLLTAVVCATAWAGEQVVLESGFRLQADRHERVGGVIRIYTQTGVTELPASAVAAIEVEEFVPRPAAPPAAPEPAAAEPVDPRRLVDHAADAHDIPREFLHLVARAESAYRPDAISPKGAIGIMQLMPETAATLNADPYDPKQNVEAGTRYLRDLLLKYKDHPDQLRRALAAYNAGPGAVDRYNGVPPYRETQLYVHKIVDQYRKTVVRRSPD
jgi:soluble lytic murein transglycosylase-like protein